MIYPKYRNITNPDCEGIIFNLDLWVLPFTFFSISVSLFLGDLVYENFTKSSWISALDHCRELYLLSVEIMVSLIRKRVENYDLNYRSFWPTTAAENH